MCLFYCCFVRAQVNLARMLLAKALPASPEEAEALQKELLDIEEQFKHLVSKTLRGMCSLIGKAISGRFPSKQ
jgi:hypothetical protein